MASSQEDTYSDASKVEDTEGASNSRNRETKSPNLLQEKSSIETSGELSKKEPELDSEKKKSAKKKAVTFNVAENSMVAAQNEVSCSTSLERMVFPKQDYFDDTEDMDDSLDKVAKDVTVVHSEPLVNLKSILKQSSSVSLNQESVVAESSQESVAAEPSQEPVVEEPNQRRVDEEPCGDSIETQERKVKWKPEVDVIYYAGDAVVSREIEELCEELEQHTRKAAYIRGYTRILPIIR